MRISANGLVVFACGCNAVFGLGSTRAVDAAYYDAHIDAPFTCPPPAMPPQFSPAFQQDFVQNCTSYTTSATTGKALASCLPGPTIDEGDRDQPMIPAAGLQDSNFFYTYPRLGPDGDTAVMHVYDKQQITNSFAEFRRDANGWTKQQDISPGFLITASTSTTRATPRHLLALSQTGAVHELIEQGGVWVDHATHDFSELGVTGTDFDFNWTPDGLRLVFTGTLVGDSTTRLLYAERDTIDQPFSPAVSMPGIDFTPPGFLTEDCGRVYFSSLGSVFYAPRD